MFAVFYNIKRQIKIIKNNLNVPQHAMAMNLFTVKKWCSYLKEWGSCMTWIKEKENPVMLGYGKNPVIIFVIEQHY